MCHPLPPPLPRELHPFVQKKLIKPRSNPKIMYLLVLLPLYIPLNGQKYGREPAAPEMGAPGCCWL